jgi:hypothetical protein
LEVATIPFLRDQVLPEVSRQSNSNTNNIAYDIVSYVKLPDESESEGYSLENASYALHFDMGDYSYTSTATPGAPNAFAPLKTLAQAAEELKAELAAQNALGTEFFNMDSHGLPVSGGFDNVLNLHIDMSDENYNYIVQNASFEVYKPFQYVRVTTLDRTLLKSVNSTAGEIRTKGQTSLYFAECLGTLATPFQVKMEDDRRLFGMEKFYLRNHLNDNSYLRDFAYYRMLARFQLPHLRTRTVQLYINDLWHGVYSLMEAADQDYVFSRNFPNYDPNNFALYKITNLAKDCGTYSEARYDCQCNSAIG